MICTTRFHDLIGVSIVLIWRKWSCISRLWRLSGIPCKHAISAIFIQNQVPGDYVHQYYRVDTYKKVYEPAILGINCDMLWGQTMFTPPLPHNFRRRGRQEEGKWMSVQENRRTRYHAKRCSRLGDNKLQSGAVNIDNQVTMYQNV